MLFVPGFMTCIGFWNLPCWIPYLTDNMIEDGYVWVYVGQGELPGRWVKAWIRIKYFQKTRKELCAP